jgi:O-antigen/teichoic acid export membrane protein
VGLAVTECGVEAIVKRELIGAPDRGAALLRAAWQLRLLLGAGCYGLLLSWTVLGVADAADRTILAVAGLMLFQPALAVGDLWLQATLRARTAVLAQAVMLTAGALGRIALIRAGAPVWAFAAISAGELLLAALLLTVLAHRAGLRWSGPDQDWRRASALFREAWPLMISSLAVILYMRIDVVMLRAMQGDAAAGIYAAAVKLSELGYFLPVALGSSLLPALLRARTAGREAYGRRLQQYFDLSAAIAYVLSVPGALLAPWLIRLVYGTSFAAAGPVLALHVWGAVFAFIGVARAHYLFNEGLGRLHLMATVSGAVLNIGLNWLWIPRYGPWGAALATVVAQAFVTWGLSFAFAATRWVAGMQTRALLLPFNWFRYVRRAD